MQSKKYNSKLRIATLEFAYLDHLKKSLQTNFKLAEDDSFIYSIIIPILKSNWINKGKIVAENWVKDGAENSPIITSFITQIDTFVMN